MGHRHVLVDQEALDLVKHRRMGRIVVAAIDRAGRDERHGRRMGRHRANLNVARVRPQQRSTGGPVLDARNVHPEAVLHVGGGVVRRESELREVVLLELDLRSIVDGEPETHQNVDDLVAHARDRVRVPEGCGFTPRQRHVERRGPKLRFAARAIDRAEPLFERGLDVAAQRVDEFANRFALVRGCRPQLLQDGRQFAFFSENLGVLVAQGLLGGRRLEAHPKGGPQDRQRPIRRLRNRAGIGRAHGDFPR